MSCLLRRFDDVLPRANDCSLGKIFERGDELCYVIFRDAPQLADLDAAELTSPEQVVDLVAANVQHVSDLLDCECLQVCESPPYIAHEVRLSRECGCPNITVIYLVRYSAERPEGLHGKPARASRGTSTLRRPGLCRDAYPRPVNRVISKRRR